jgi:hypothetical protein
VAERNAQSDTQRWINPKTKQTTLNHAIQPNVGKQFSPLTSRINQQKDCRIVEADDLQVESNKNYTQSSPTPSELKTKQITNYQLPTVTSKSV